ncbi:MAG: hypothetical protein U0796_00100 [Gemmatales bacterium]
MRKHPEQLRQSFLQRLIGRSHLEKQSVIRQFPRELSMYAVPKTMLRSIQKLRKTGKAVLNEKELQSEYAYTEFCDEAQVIGHRGSIGVSCDMIFRLFNYRPTFQFKPSSQLAEWAKKQVSYLGIQTAFDDTAVERAMNVINATPEMFLEPQLSYLGWLHASPVYLQERDELRTQWEAAGSPWQLLHGRNYLRQWHEHAIKDDLAYPLAERMRQFAHRWNLTGWATWDLPNLLELNLGGPIIRSHMMELDAEPHLHVPPHLKVSSTLDVRPFLTSNTGEHLEEWKQILDKEIHRPYGKGFIISFFQEKVLGAVLGKRVYRRKRWLDEVFAMACESTENPLIAVWELETVQKLRQNYQRICKRGLQTTIDI